MKHLLTGVAVAAVLAIAAPAGAQSPMTPAPSAAPMASGPAPDKAAAPRQMKRKMRHTRARGHGKVARGHARRDPGDAMTSELNRQELARIQGAGMAPPPGMMPPPPGMGPPPAPGPRPSGR